MRTERRAWSTAGLPAVLAAACAGASSARQEAAGPEDTVRALIAADNRSDMAGALACYAEDAAWLPPAGDAVRGKREIAARYAKMFAAYTPDLTVDVAETLRGERHALVRGTTRGRLVPRVGGDAVLVRDAFEALLRQKGGGWEITHLIWRPDQER